MGFLYSNEHKFWQRRLIDFILLSGFLAIYGMMVDFIPTRQIEYPARILSYIFAFIFTLFLYIRIITDSKVKNTFIKSCKIENVGIVRKCLHILVLLLAIPFMVYICAYANLAFSAPSLLHKLSDYESKLTIYVKEKRSSRRCRRGVYIDKKREEIKDYETFYKRSVCGISKENWSRIKSNDKIILVGTQSYFGFKYYGFIF